MGACALATHTHTHTVVLDCRSSSLRIIALFSDQEEAQSHEAPQFLSQFPGSSAHNHLLSDTFVGQDSESPSIDCLHNNNHLQPYSKTSPVAKHALDQPDPDLVPVPVSASAKRRLSVERSLSSEDQPQSQQLQQSTVKPARVYTISRESGMLGARGSEESLELEVLKGPQARTNHQRTNHRSSHAHHHHAPSSQPLQSSGSAHNIRDWGSRRSSSREDCPRPPCHSQRSLDLDTVPRDASKQRKKLERMYSEDQVSTEDRDHSNNWLPKENMFSFQTATTTMQAAFRGFADRKRRKREQEATTLIESAQKDKKKKKLIITLADPEICDAALLIPGPALQIYPSALSGNVCTHNSGILPDECEVCVCVFFGRQSVMLSSSSASSLAFADRKAKSFSRSWSDPTPIKPDSLHDSRDSGDLQASSGTLDEGEYDDVDWEEEKELERLACESDDFIPPKIMLISSKVPKAEYVPNIICRNDPSIIPILYDHEHATFDDILEEIEKKLNAYRKGCKIWNMLIFCQGGPGHLYLLKNKVATFAKVEKEEDMIQFWKKLARLMSLLNPEPNLIHIMGCYVLGNANGEKLVQNLKRLMRPYAVEFKSPLELSAQGKEMIETYFDFRLFRLWKSRQHSKLLDYDDLL
ncbi:NMDA receptor synaptonuclear signaling and neuronal migration factor [Bagarius yarrelli]|uniref:NMDA receptor synaptonuclear signaling and neuronal migration factor n=1 Tax=Bagarius yarrelli TaxID=175774 RepID=A0A556V601_BAGYA|nr:NMDA receptor synaptonuclear signaling and neuronal migration factor [Bagarius yarrelli]